MWYDTQQNKNVLQYIYEPLLKNFAQILSSKKEKKETAAVRRSLTRGCSSDKAEKNLYPFRCQFWKQYRKQHINHLIPTILTTKNGRQTKKTAEISDSKLYLEIKDVDLIAKEFSHHIEPSYLKFTKCVRPEKNNKK